jgi:immune inhibitor A
MKYKLYLTACLLVLGLSCAHAVPAKKGVKRTIKLADGTSVVAELKGDEFASYWQANDGKCYVQDIDSRTFKITDKAQVVNRGFGKTSKANDERIKRFAKRGPKREITGAFSHFTGTKKGLIILVNFKDVKFGRTHTRTMFDNIANKKGFTNSLGFKGSVKDYFLAQSKGQFELDFDVVGPYTLSQNMAYYGAHTKDGDVDAKAGHMVLEACQMADKDVNYKDYDWDGDGEVDQVFVIYAGFGEADGGSEDTIWPHESMLSASTVGKRYETKDGVNVNTYACGNENTYDMLGRSRINGIGTICHEFSHCLGYPDLYDTNYGGNFGMGSFDLMCSGSYNGESFCPPNYSAYEKWIAGWITPIVLDKPASVKGMQAQDVKYGQAFVVYNDNNKNEYYLIENRQQNVGIWDKQLPASGMMITHVDYDENIWERNNVNTIVNYSNQYGPGYAYLDNDHQRLTIFHADNEEGASTKSQAGDLYPFNGNNSLTDTSSPAATIYQGGSTMGKPITNITQNEDGSIDFDFMGGSNDNIISGIHFVENDEMSSFGQGVYSLDGRYMGTSANGLAKGIYIVNGKKIVK